jgi:hypothetical protein
MASKVLTTTIDLEPLELDDQPVHRGNKSSNFISAKDDFDLAHVGKVAVLKV